MTSFLVKLEWGAQPPAGSPIKATRAHTPCPGNLCAAVKRNVCVCPSPSPWGGLWGVRRQNRSSPCKTCLGAICLLQTVRQESQSPWRTSLWGKTDNKY